MRFRVCPIRLLVLPFLAAAIVIGGWITFSERPQQAETVNETAGRDSDLYRISTAEARAKLANMGLPETMLGVTPHYAVDTESDPYCFFWIIKKDQSEIFRFVVGMAAEGDGTRIWTDVQAPFFDRQTHLIAPALRLFPAVKGLYAAALREQVRATLENRPVNPAKIDPATLAEVQAFLGQMSKHFD